MSRAPPRHDRTEQRPRLLDSAVRRPFRSRPPSKRSRQERHFGPLARFKGLAFLHHSGSSPKRDAIRAISLALQITWIREGSATSWKWFGLREATSIF